ncbi:transglutaminaseTgpA domain-containing protein [Cryptosporangium sp. NPDC048952]|uniref:transglutaminase family protein n=1 Tax=Cryptosporangium sp. NPDC048952 TaxID=3363961 RepID=UPI003716D667
MNRRTYVSAVAGVATLLCATSLRGVLEGWSWLPVVGGGVIVVTLAGIGARALRTPAWLQPVVGALAVLLYTTVVFGHDRFLGIIPTPATIVGLRADVSNAFADIAELAAPVPARPGILLLTVGGVGLVAILVDVLASILGRAALAGLPLLGLYTVPVAVDRNGIGWLPFALGAAGFCWLLAAEHGTTIRRWGRPFHAGNTPEAQPTRSGGGSLVAGRLAIFGIVLAVLIPAGVPALSAEGLHSLFEGGLPGSGGGRTVTAINPVTELRGQLTQDDPVDLLRVRTNDRQPFYLRLATLERFTGSGWTLRDMTAKQEARVRRGVPNVSGISGGTPTVSQETSIEIVGLTQSRYLPLYSNPSSVDVDGDWRFDRGSEAVFSTVDTTENLRYRFESRRVEYTPDLLRSAAQPNPGDSTVKRYTELKDPDPTVEKQVDELVAGKSTEYEKAVAINNFFSKENGFEYDLQTAAGTSESAIVAFLENRRGYCEQYASAMAYMARLAGLPARVAIGFGYGSPQGGSWLITSHDAHAWVEIMFPGIGWVPFDPTPPTGTGNTGDLSWVDNGTTDNGESTEQTPVEEEQAAPLPSEEAAAPQASDPAVAAAAEEKDKDKSKSWYEKLIPYLGWAALPIGLLLAFVVWGSARRHVRAKRFAVMNGAGDPAAAAHAAWDEVVDTLVDLDGRPSESAETPRGLSSRLRADGLDESAQGALTLIASAEEQARYAARVHAMPGLVEAVVTVRAALHQRSPRGRRVIAELLPPSTRARARSAVRALPAKARGH